MLSTEDADARRPSSCKDNYRIVQRMSREQVPPAGGARGLPVGATTPAAVHASHPDY